MHKNVIIFLSISLNICFGSQKIEKNVSFQYPQHTFWLRNEKIISNRYPGSGVVLDCIDS